MGRRAKPSLPEKHWSCTRTAWAIRKIKNHMVAMAAYGSYGPWLLVPMVPIVPLALMLPVCGHLWLIWLLSFLRLLWPLMVPTYGTYDPCASANSHLSYGPKVPKADGTRTHPSDECLGVPYTPDPTQHTKGQGSSLHTTEQRHPRPKTSEAKSVRGR